MTEIEQVIAGFDPITLDEMSGVKLMNRTDTKFVTTEDRLLRLLEMSRGDYRAQEVAGKRLSPYYSLYFDTPSHAMYIRHETGHLNRQKLRVRSYVDSDLSFLEVKTKDNHGRTKKKRIRLADAEELRPGSRLGGDNEGEMEQFLDTTLRYPAEEMRTVLENQFHRITLVNRDMTERLTIDMGLKVRNTDTGLTADFSGIAIVELKRDGMVPSPVVAMLRDLRIKPMGFSKYCIGMAFTDPALPHNRIKPRLHQINKMLTAARS